MPLFRWTLKTEKKALILWAVSLTITLLLFLFMYPSILKEKEAYEKILAVYPKEVLEAFAIELDTLLSFHGYLGYVYGYILLALGIYSMRLGLTTIGKEISRNTSEFLFTKPVKRSRVLLEKGLAAFLLMLFLTLSLLLAALFMEYLYAEKKEPGITFLIVFSAFFLQMLFYSLGLLMGILKRKVRFFSSSAIGVVSAFYILSMVSQVLQKDYLRYAAPFRYFDVSEIMRSGTYDRVFLLFSLLLTTLLLLFSFTALKRKALSAG
ncbi:ABC transporter permease subunit [Proteiniclasticum ruminis]|uniref:ABC-2 type transport system permease protein n=1 Tax=Proteiniclasticum ruminis TaxID=398199 RepID=A0A1I5E6L9_9CLOT|nr:ABC transporter permease subunit [Proteiniclasticum ruminis]SFO06940.1 ABC-2 type transport system permease protein [Proteiniclasticum ruminis]